MVQWSPGKRVVVLGAGATRGAQFVVDANPRPRCEPPLNADFFTQLQRITTARHQATIRAVVKDAVTLFGPNFSLTLEEYFTQLQAMIATAKSAKGLPAGFKEANLVARRDRLLDALSATLEESADVAKEKSPARRNRCEYHDNLVEALEPQDTIISFNYDCIIDHALRSTGARKWSAQIGYNFPDYRRVEAYHPWNADQAPATQNMSINLLKLHGSLNWFPFPDGGKGPIKLRERPYKQAGNKQYEIVPPEYVKRQDAQPIYTTLWSHAEMALRRAEVLAFVGFSFTPTDLDVEALFRLALISGKKKLKRVVIANPSGDHRRRIRSILAPSLRDGASVVQFDDFRALSPYVADVLAVS